DSLLHAVRRERQVEVHDPFGVLEVSPLLAAPVADENEAVRVSAKPRDLSFDVRPSEPSVIACHRLRTECSGQMAEQFVARAGIAREDDAFWRDAPTARTVRVLKRALEEGQAVALFGRL